MKIAIGSDHAGYQLKAAIIKMLESRQIESIDLGTDSEESCDYPEYAHKVAESVSNLKTESGILICGSANGVAMTSNKHAKIRAAICWNEEITKLARLHNDANIICLPARFINTKFALKLVEIFLNTKFEGGRHQRRVDKI